MSLVPRYKINTLWGWFGFVQDNENGKFCEYRDYVKLQAENGRLRHEQKMRAIPVEAKLMDRVAALQAENERLRKDLDYVLDDWGCFKVGHSGGSGIDSVFKRWQAANGGQS